MKEEIATLRKELDYTKGAREDAVDQVGKMEKERRKLDLTITTLEGQIKSMDRMLAKKTDSLESELRAKDTLLESKDQLISQLQEELSIELSKKDKEYHSSASQAFVNGDLLERLHRLETENRRLQYENRTLYESTRTTKLLQERLHTAEQRLALYRDLEERYNELQAQLLVKESEGRGLESNSASLDIRSLLERTSEYAKLQEAFGLLEAKHKEIMIKYEELEEGLAKFATDYAKLDNANKELENKLLLIQGQEAIAKSEIASLREHLDAATKLEKANKELILQLTKKRKDVVE